jgi:hypothetical protein
MTTDEEWNYLMYAGKILRVWYGRLDLLKSILSLADYYAYAILTARLVSIELMKAKYRNGES